MRSGGIFDFESKKARISEIESLAQAPDFWDDPNKAQAILREKSDFEAKLSEFGKAQSAYDDAEAMLELAAEAGDAESQAEASASLEAVSDAVDRKSVV